jgi:stage V sporulation protein G
VNITEVRVKLVSDNTERLKAFCSITLDSAFVIRDLKVIDGATGPFVAMPSRKLADRCPKCGSKNHLRARHCNDCGARLKDDRAPRDSQGRVKLHADVAHPINTACRERIQQTVVEAYKKEIDASQRPDYKPATYEDDEDFSTSEYDTLVSELKESAHQRTSARSQHDRRPSRGERGERPADTTGDNEPGVSESVFKEPEASPPRPQREEPSAEPASEGFASGIL